MKDFLNVFVILILTGFTVGIAYIQLIDAKTPWSLLYVPDIVFLLMWGIKINDDYKHK